MAEKRSPLRHKKRLSVRFGVDKTTRIAFSEDISMVGMFIRCLNAYPPNTRILIEFMLGSEQKVVLEARVMWGIDGAPEPLSSGQEVRHGGAYPAFSQRRGVLPASLRTDG